LWENLWNGGILYVKSELTIKFGCEQFVAPQVQEIWQEMDKALPV